MGGCRHHNGLYLLLYVLCLAARGLSKKPVLSPPTITIHPNIEITFKDREKVEIPCKATGEPTPSYSWMKNGQPLTISNIDIKQITGLGTIVINEPVTSYEGIYQCIAANQFGSALSIKTVVRKAVQEPFPSIKELKVHRPIVGTSLTLHCQPPLSYPQGLIYWGENREGSRLKPIENSDRISLDYEGSLHFSNVKVEDGLLDRHTSYVCASQNGVIRSVMQGEDQKIIPVQRRGNLYFANIQPDDARGGVSYICIVQNTELRSLVQGDDQKIDPISVSGMPKHEAPKLLWPKSNVNEVALKGQMKKMKCIFSGYPTPIVNWTRENGHLPAKVIINSFGQEITIPDADYSDIGGYKCTGRNIVSEASRIVTLGVESPPYWKNDKPPEDVNTSEDESARFDCQAIGQPKPEINWLINGEPVSEMTPDPRRTVGKDYLIYQKVTKTDAQVIQCNASNLHGYVFANAFLNVLAEPPSFIDTPQAVEKVAEGQNVTLTCHVFGAPKPVIT